MAPLAVMDFPELLRLIENIVRLGTIAEIQHGKPPRVRVQSGGIGTDWLPWAERRAGATRTWNPPTKGEQVLLFCPSGDPRSGIVLCGIPSDANDTPSHSPNETVTLYPDGGATTYNHATGTLTIAGIQKVIVEAATSVLVKCPATTFDGDVTVTGLLSYQNGISGQGGANGNAIQSDITHSGGNLSSNGVVVHKHDHGGVRRGGDPTDNRGFEADQLDIELDDADGMLGLPEKGATLSLALGWLDTGVVDKGTYKVDELEHTGPPDRLVIRARSADLASGLTTRREQSYRGQTIGAIVRAIAARHALTPAVTAALDNLVIDHIDQTGESDANFLTRLATDHDAIATVKQGKLLFIRTGAAQSASGVPLPTVHITRASGDTHSFAVADRDNYTGVKAYYQDARRAQKGEVVVDGSNGTKTAASSSSAREPTAADVLANSDPDNLKVLRHTYATKSNAERAARAEWQRIQRGVASFRITLARGRPELFPELPASVTGWKPEIDGTGWVVAKVKHTYSGNGYTSALEMEVATRGKKVADEF